MEADPARTLQDIGRAYVLSRCLHVIADVGVADALGDVPMPVAEMASAAGADVDALSRVLRLLASYGVFELQGEQLSHSPASRLLRSDSPNSMRAFVQTFGSRLNWSVYEELEYSVRTGLPAMDKVVPEGLWAYREQHPETARIFNTGMDARAARHVASVLAAYDFSGLGVIGDIGGGRGRLIRAVLDATPTARGVLFDLPSVIDEAAGSVPARLTMQGGDFFRDELPVCDAYLLMDILHDWGNEEAGAILRAIARSAPAGARMLLIEYVLPDDPGPSWSKLLDIHMLALFGGRQRTVGEFSDLLRSAGFVLRSHVNTASGISILEAVRE